MRRHDLDWISLVSGAVFTVIGLLYLVVGVADVDLDGRFVWPLVLVASGGALIWRQTMGPALTPGEPRLRVEAVGAAGSMLGTKALQIFDQTTSVVRAVLRWTEFYKHESCGKCTPCREGTYWITGALEKFEHGHGTAAEVDTLVELCGQISGRSFCALGDAAATPYPAALKYFRDEFVAATTTSAMSSASTKGSTASPAGTTISPASTALAMLPTPDCSGSRLAGRRPWRTSEARKSRMCPAMRPEVSSGAA